MKTIDQVINEYDSQTLDGRDLGRFCQFCTKEQVIALGYSLRDEDHTPIEYTEENVLKQLKKDVEFGFEKALSQRGISSILMYRTVSMWNWVLENELADFSDDNYAQYGLPLFKATAVLYGFDNPIGDDNGNEDHYDSDWG